MTNPLKLLAIAALAAAPAHADFSGQTILGPVIPGVPIAGNNTGASDDNDGWFSGTHVFFIWEGGDDVFALNWPGGDLNLTMTYNNLVDDPDLFLYVPGSYDESSFDSIANTGIESISVPAAAPGLYYILVDSETGKEGAYEITVAPAPGTLALLGAGLIPLARRRR